jgi:hypothetical protein
VSFLFCPSCPVLPNLSYLPCHEILDPDVKSWLL